jgi:hypothetical protein
MKLSLIVPVVLILFALCAPASAQTKKPVADATTTCKLGTEYSINPGRQLAAGEKEVTIYEPGKVVITTQREAPGSSHIVLRRCKLPDEKLKGVVGGVMPWFKICGQDFTPEGWSLPVEPPPATAPAPPQTIIVKVEGIPDTIRLKGEVVHSGEVKLIHDGTVVPAAPPPTFAPAPFPEPRKKGFPWKKTLAIGGGIAAGGYAAWYYWPCWFPPQR